MAKNPGTKFEDYMVGELQRFYPDAHRRKGSGSTHRQGDISAGPFEGECKDNPTQKSISVSGDDWKKIEARAAKIGKIPIFLNQTEDGVFITMKWLNFETILSDAIQAHIFLEGEPPSV